MSELQSVPEPGDRWRWLEPAAAGFDPGRLADAVAFAGARETPWPVDLRAAMEAGNAPEGEHGTIIGPMRPRGGTNGIIVRHGAIVAEWGDTHRVDMTFSAAKSYLSMLAGLAVARGLIGDLDDPVRDSVDDGGFDGPHNAQITWRQFLQGTSEWEGTLWGKPDHVDRNRAAMGGHTTGPRGQRTLRPPGSYFEYNDVRVNRLSLALLRCWGEALPEVFAREIMRPIGASDTWQWHGYENSWVGVNGRRVCSVPGGGHWGGGVWIATRDQARLGQLYLRSGRWGSRSLLPERWVEESTTPSPLNPNYGYLWWLNTNRTMYKSAGTSSYFAIGGGLNITWVDPEHDMIVVIRWLAPAAADEVMAQILAALNAGA